MQNREVTVWTMPRRGAGPVGCFVALAVVLTASVGCVGAAPDGVLLELPGAARPEYADGETLSLADKAAHFEADLDRYIAPEGFLTYRQPVTATAHVYRDLADVAIWTGCLLTAESMRLSVTEDPQAKRRVLQLLEGLHALTWVTGEPGLYARGMWPRVSPGIRPHHATRDGRGPAAAYRYRGDVSKDQVAGVVCGLAFAWRALRDDQRARRLVTGQSAALADHLLSHGMSIYEDGQPTRFGDHQGYIYGLPIGVNAMIALAVIKLAAVTTGSERFEVAYARLVEEGYPETAWFSKVQLLYRTNHNNDNMQLLGTAALLALEDDPAVREPVIDGLRRTWSYVRHEGNSWFNYVIMSGLGRDAQGARDARRTLERFPLERRSRQGRVRLVRALPITYRAPTIFVWRSCPYALRQATRDRSEMSPPVDYLLAYWAGRYWGFLDSE
jgi:hypothetical protein